MIRFVLRRIASGLVLLFVISTAAFFVLYLAAGDIARALLGENATNEQILAKQAELGLDRPVTVRYLDWLTSALHGDLGTSWLTSQSVFETVMARLPVTLSLVLICILITAVLSILLGVAAAVRRGWIDMFVQVLSMIGFAIPSFVLALFLVTIFAVELGWLPATGYVNLTESPSLWLASLTLPLVALVLSAVASTTQQIRSAIIQVMQRDYVRTLVSRGLNRRQILFRHVLRGAAPAGLTVLSLQFVNLMGGAVVVETIFALPGMGSLTVNSTALGDLPVLMGVIVNTVVVVLLVNLTVDLANGWLIPKARAA